MPKQQIVDDSLSKTKICYYDCITNEKTNTSYYHYEIDWQNKILSVNIPEKSTPLTIYLSVESEKKIKRTNDSMEKYEIVKEIIINSQRLYQLAVKTNKDNFSITQFKMTDSGITLLQEKKGVHFLFARIFDYFFGTKIGYSKTILTEAHLQTTGVLVDAPVKLQQSLQTLDDKASRVLSPQGTFTDVYEYVRLGGSLSKLADMVKEKATEATAEVKMKLSFAQVLKKEQAADQAGDSEDISQLIVDQPSDFAKGILSIEDIETLYVSFEDAAEVLDLITKFRLLSFVDTPVKAETVTSNDEGIVITQESYDETDEISLPEGFGVMISSVVEESAADISVTDSSEANAMINIINFLYRLDFNELRANPAHELCKVTGLEEEKINEHLSLLGQS